jgi:hypothetical protein
MNHLICSVAFLLLWIATTVAAPAPFPRPPRAKQQLTLDQLERQLRERGIQLTDVKRDGPRAWIIIFPNRREGCLVGAPRTRSLRFEADDLPGAIRAFLRWYRVEDERRLKLLRAARAIP